MDSCASAQSTSSRECLAPPEREKVPGESREPWSLDGYRLMSLLTMSVSRSVLRSSLVDRERESFVMTPSDRPSKGLRVTLGESMLFRAWTRQR